MNKYDLDKRTARMKVLVAEMDEIKEEMTE